ncbi:hypothetical protein ERO13_D08G181400v2 [Gossypium hirsutum]|nr:hypothetical protein ERO13_D08G181400v2 [Gossypium hirsutum]
MKTRLLKEVMYDVGIHYRDECGLCHMTRSFRQMVSCTDFFDKEIITMEEDNIVYLPLQHFHLYHLTEAWDRREQFTRTWGTAVVKSFIYCIVHLLVTIYLTQLKMILQSL